MIDLEPYSEGSDEVGSTVYPTRRVRAMTAYPRVVYMWRLTRIEWFDPSNDGTTWGSTDHAVLRRGVAL